MSLEMEAAIFKRESVLFAKSDYRSEWLIIKAEFCFVDRTIVTELVGREVRNLVTAILGHEPQERLAKLLWDCRNQPVGVCWEQVRNRLPKALIRSFFHISATDAADIPVNKPKTRRLIKL